MQYPVAIFAVAAAIAAPAVAADQPQFGPAPAWVKPVALPTNAENERDAPFRLLLSDQQVSLEPGRQTAYIESAFRIEAPPGLELGNLSFPWQPETSVLTVHKLHILRDGETIDVLASGQSFIVARREQNLESAMLDGTLTANIQPEGLQVGDILTFAISVTHSNPVLQQHVEQFAATWNGVPIDRAHLRVQWPSKVPVRLRQTGELPPLKPVKAGDITSIELTMDNVQPILPPRGAPSRYRVNRLVELSDFASWADLGAMMEPLYRKAAALPAEGTLQAELDRIRALSPDPKVRAEAALALVQDRIRYVAILMGVDGLVPANAETTWSRRYGDCKAKTALLLGLLRALDIEAEAVLVGSNFGNGLDAHLPMVGLFDHVLVRATINGRSYWLDGTRTGDTSLDLLQVPNFGWGLPVREKGAELVRMLPEPLAAPNVATTIHFDASAGLDVPAQMQVEQLFRGDQATRMRLAMASLTAEQRNSQLRSMFRSEYNTADVKSVATDFNAKTGEYRVSMEGTAKLDWSKGWYEIEDVRIGYQADFTRDPGPNQDAPFAVPYPYYNSITQTIQLPAGFEPFQSMAAADVNITVAGIEYTRHAKLADNLFTIVKTERSIAPEFPAQDAAEAQKQLRALTDKRVFLYVPKNLSAAGAEVSTEEAALEFVKRGFQRQQERAYAEAIADFDRALELMPNKPLILVGRAYAKFMSMDLEGAEKDIVAATAAGGAEPPTVSYYFTLGRIALERGNPQDALSAFSKTLEINPEFMGALKERARANQSLRNFAAASEDATAVLKHVPNDPDMQLIRINHLRREGKFDEALAATEAMAANSPDDGGAQVNAAVAFAAFGQREKSAQAFERALAIKPHAYIYWNRARTHPRLDIAARRADMEAALRLDPTIQPIDVIELAQAALEMDAGNFAAAIAIYTKHMAEFPQRIAPILSRAMAYALSSEPKRAEQDLATAKQMASRPSDWNLLCWAKAITDIAVDSALADCDEALRQQPDDPAFLDSRALVLLRLGRLDDSIAAYDAILAKWPRAADSLYGRAIAWARKGNKEKSDADVAAALRQNPKVSDEFDLFGIKP